jgi:hypothetical protein
VSRLRRGAFVLALIVIAALALCFTGCAQIAQFDEPVERDVTRYRFVEAVMNEHAERHPEQAETVNGFLSSWRDSITERGGVIGGDE